MLNLKVYLSVLTITLSLPQMALSSTSIWDSFIDPMDGKFDVSNWLLEKKGFLPVPIITSDPAIGYGGGAALLFFHESESDEEAAGESDKAGLPGIP